MIEEVKPRRELDELVAEKVMGIEVGIYQCPFSGRLEYRCKFSGQGSVFDLPEYSTDIRAAWDVVARLTSRERPYFMLVVTDAYDLKPQWRAEFDLDRPMKRVYTQASIAPHAICLAALKALDHDIQAQQ